MLPCRSARWRQRRRNERTKQGPSRLGSPQPLTEGATAVTTTTNNQTVATHPGNILAYRMRIIQAAVPVGLALLLLIVAAPAVQANNDTPTNDPTATKCPGPNCFCGAFVKGKVVFVSDMQCMEHQNGLIVDADGTKIDLNGFRLQCVGTGFHQSCQGAVNLLGGLDTDPVPDIGINTNGHSNVEIKGSGSVLGFDIGIEVKGPAKNVTVQRLNVSGPDAVGGFFTTLSVDRPTTRAIRVENVACPSSYVSIRRNSIDNHTDGIFLNAANCLEVEGNFIHDNNP